MIDLIQWRVCIGMWCCCMNSVNSHPSVKDYHRENETLGIHTNILRILLSHTSVWLYTLTVCIFLQLILSGDVESNPGPVEITAGKAVILLNKCGFNFKSNWSWLTSILNVPLEVKGKMRAIIKEDETYEYAIEIALDWWIKNTSEASWKVLISSVEECEETDTAHAMRKKLSEGEAGSKRCVRTEIVGANPSFMTVEDDYPPSKKALISQNEKSTGDSCTQVSCEPNQLTPFNILKRHFSEILDVVYDPNRLANDLWAANLITNIVKDNILSTPSVPRYDKASILLNEVQRSLKVNENPKTLILFCKVLSNQGNSVICKNMLKDLDVPLDVLSSEVISDTEIFIRELRDQYLQEPVVHNDLLGQRIGGDKFGQLGLIKGHGGILSQSEGKKRSLAVLQGKLDCIMNVSRKIGIQDVLEHNDYISPIKVVVDGPPGVGKTTLCRKLCNMWAKNELKKCSFELVFLLHLRDDRVTSAESIYDLVSLFHCSKKLCETVSDHIMETNGKDTLLIFDGWDEFEGRNKDRSFVQDIIHGKHPLRCNIMVTSRTYASANLLEIQIVNRHIEVLGFEKSEILSYIMKELTTEKSKQLIMKLEMREDVLSMCYIPFLCSMLVRVYLLFDYTLPNTLTELYQKFIIYAMKRAMNRSGFNLRRIESLNNLQEDQKAFDQLCYCAYMNLQNKGNTTFTEDQIQSSKCKHFGLMNCYTIADTTRYQFLHLTIQEFLAAWWISQQDDQKRLFREHFKDTHFRMTLRFVAGLTKLIDESYQEYFNKEVDLQCVRRPSFSFESHQCSVFHRNPQMLHECISEQDRDEYPLHEHFATDSIQLLHLIYESQNTILCQMFASSIKNPSLCVGRVISSQVDLLCLSFFLKNSKKAWNCLHFGYVDKHMKLVEHTDINSCTIMKAEYWSITSVIKIHQTSLCKCLQESYISIATHSDVTHLRSMFTDLFKLPHLNILHVTISIERLSNASEYNIDESLEKAISTNYKIKELFISVFNIPQCCTLIKSILTGVQKNDTIQFFSLSCSPYDNTTISSLQVEELLKNNQTLEAVKMNIPIKGLLSFVCITSANDSLRALSISNNTVRDIITYPVEKTETLSSGLENVGRNIVHLKSLSLQESLIPLSVLFDSNPFLQHLDIVLEKEESLVELFKILSSNRTIISLRIRNGSSFSLHSALDREVGKSLRLMLSSNQTLQCLEIKGQYKSQIPLLLLLLLKYLTAGLRANNTLKELDIDFILTDDFKEFFEATNNLKSLAVSFYEFKPSDEIFMSWYHDEIIPHATNMLNRNKDMKFVKVAFFHCLSFGVTVKDDWRPTVHKFWETVLLHPSLCYICVHISSQFMIDILNNMKQLLITQREEKKLGPPPLVEIRNIFI